MDRTFDLTLDIQKPVDPQNSFRFFRGDNVVFNFVYKNGDEDFSTSDAAKLRVYAKKVYARGVSPDEQPLFAEETTTVSTVSFNSSSTAGDAGNYLMAVILLDANNNLITAQGIYFDLIENGYAGIYQPGVDFRDQILDALSQAQAAATQAQTAETNAAASATQAQASAQAAATSQTAAAQSETNAAGSASSAQASATAASQSESNALSSKNAAEAAAQIAQSTDAGKLMLSKLGAGQLWFNRGKLSVANWTSVVIPLPFSLAIEYEVESWDGISYEYDNEFSFFNCTNADWSASGYPIYGFRLTKNGESTLGFTLGGCGGEGMGTSRGWNGSVSLPTGRHTLAIAIPAPDESGNSPASIPVYIDGENAGSLFASVSKHNESVSFQVPLVINERGVYAGGATFNEFEIALSRISVFNFDMTAEDAPYTVADYASGKLIPPALKPSQVSLALENYTIARNATTTLVKDASGNSNDATVTGSVAGDNDQSIKAFVDEIKTQINQSNG